MRRELDRRDFLRLLGAGAGMMALPGCAKPGPAEGVAPRDEPGVTPGTAPPKGRPNVLFIAIDDLNDWTGCLGGHPNAKTPNIDALAARGVLFTRTYCAAPACNPSRAALMTGIRPTTSGVYTNPQPWRKSPVLKDAVTLPQHFIAAGYEASGSGKIYHGRFPDPPSWETYWPSKTQPRPADPVPDGRPLNGFPRASHFDWGPVDARDEEMGDWQVADWVTGRLREEHERPFFLACGFFRPHLPWYVPQKYFDMHPLDSVKLPDVDEHDLDDVPEAGRRMAKPDGDHANVLKHKQWRRAVQAYLASGSFADACVGRVMAALDASPHRDNTIVVLWADHGWHLGEKLHWRKFALWEEATRNPMLFVAPGVTRPGGRCDRPVGLIDIYPTLVELCGLPEKPELDGESLVRLLKDPSAARERPALTTHGKGNHSVRSERWRYIRYADGSEELYDHNVDELERKNLASDLRHDAVKADLARWIPRTEAKSIPAVNTGRTKKRKRK